MEHTMTPSQKSLSRRYLVYRFFTNMWFIGAVWLYFYRIFINDQQVGLLDAGAFAIGLLAEVPSGALADKFGRDRLVKLGHILAGTGMLIQAFGGGFLPLFAGQAITMIGVAFASGADEALFFERLKFDRRTTLWRRLMTRGTQVALVASVFATVTGGLLHAVNPHIPWIITGIAFIAAAAVIWPVKELRTEKKKQSATEEIADYIQDIRTGFRQFRLPKLWIYVPIIITVQALFYTVDWGLLRLILLDRFEFSPFWGAIAVASSSLLTVGVLSYVHKHAEKLHEKQVIVAVALSAVASLLLSLADIGIWGYVVIVTLHVGEQILQPFMSEVLNNHAPENQRATVLSVASFLKSLPYVVLAPIIGYLSMTNNIEYFLVGWSLLILIATGMYVVLKKRDSRIIFPRN